MSLSRMCAEDERFVRDATHRYRAIRTLSNLAAIFVLCATALMGDHGHVAIGVEWLAVSSVAAAVHVCGYVKARGSCGSQTALSRLRRPWAPGFYLALIAGSIVLLVGSSVGSHISAWAMVVIGSRRGDLFASSSVVVS